MIEQRFSCNNCKYHTYEEGEYSYCERKRCRLGSRERNWNGAWKECEWTCFVPNEQTKRYIYNKDKYLG